jgi:alpha-galactosidase
MGVDVFVIDTGWYEKTGDWRVSRERFPDGLGPIKAKLDGYGMKLGLWFNPVIAAVSSRMRAEHDECVMSRDGKQSEPHEVWETEASQGMCLVSRYAEAFADELIRLYHEVGVTYFKWDAIDQYGCNDPSHNHGTSANTDQERSACYGFLLITAMASVVERLCEVCPEAIVDFDITEGGRAVGLSFLSVGKYFLINNGPYYHNYDIPAPEGRNINMFFYPGPARGWICRKPLDYDRWIPSILFLTHYFPDDPADNQWITLASLMLGHNGIWGDLLTVSDEGVSRLGDTLARYKQVRDDVTKAQPVRFGPVGGSPEVYEKINNNGRGLVSLFSSHRGSYTYVTKNVVDAQCWQTEGATVHIDSQGRAVIEVVFDKPGARVALFGV